METFIKAGLIKENADKSLFFETESEAASLYTSINKDIENTYIIISYFDENETFTLENIEKFISNYINIGEYYRLYDLGGGAGDIVGHLVGLNNNLNEIHVYDRKYSSSEIDKLRFEDYYLNVKIL